jgi:hypothetical protein
VKLRYAIVTPARNEATTLGRLAESLVRQTVAPAVWVIVENGSTDDTVARARGLAREHSWIAMVEAVGADGVVRGGPVVRAFERGLADVPEDVEVVIKVDADTTFPPEYHERLLTAFEADEHLGIASGSAWEQVDGEWEQRHMTGDHVWGAARAYRRPCLDVVLPLEEQMGWDGVDVLKASLAGWRTRTITDLPFRHHRAEGERDGARHNAWAAQGRASWFMGYRFPYLIARALHHARREPAALALVTGYLGAALRRTPRCADVAVRAAIRRDQRLRHLRSKHHQAAGRSA